MDNIIKIENQKLNCIFKKCNFIGINRNNLYSHLEIKNHIGIYKCKWENCKYKCIQKTQLNKPRYIPYVY